MEQTDELAQLHLPLINAAIALSSADEALEAPPSALQELETELRRASWLIRMSLKMLNE